MTRYQVRYYSAAEDDDAPVGPEYLDPAEAEAFAREFTLVSPGRSYAYVVEVES